MSDFYNEPLPEDKLIICEECKGIGDIVDTSVEFASGMKKIIKCPKCEGLGEVPEPKPDQEMLDNNDRMGDEKK